MFIVSVHLILKFKCCIVYYSISLQVNFIEVFFSLKLYNIQCFSVFSSVFLFVILSVWQALITSFLILYSQSLKIKIDYTINQLPKVSKNIICVFQRIMIYHTYKAIMWIPYINHA